MVATAAHSHFYHFRSTGVVFNGFACKPIRIHAFLEINGNAKTLRIFFTFTAAHFWSHSFYFCFRFLFFGNRSNSHCVTFHCEKLSYL